MSDAAREQFADQVLTVVGRRFPLVQIGRAEQPFAVRINGHVASLENLYRMSLLRPDETARQIERWIVELLRAAEGSPDLDSAFDEVKERILPLIVPEIDGEDPVAVHQPLIAGLGVTYGLDNDRTISYLTKRRVENWNVSLEELHETALNNLMQRSESMTGHAAQDGNGNIYLILFQTMDGYDASRLLLPNLHDKLCSHLGSPFAAAIPTRDILLCFRDEEATIDQLRPQIETDYRQMPHQLTDRLLLVTPDGIAPRV